MALDLKNPPTLSKEDHFARRSLLQQQTIAENIRMHHESTNPTNFRMRKDTLLLFSLILLLLIHFRNSATTYEKIPVFHDSQAPGAKGYLVWSDSCKIPEIDPYLPEVIQFLKRDNPLKCVPSNSITQIIFNTTIKQYVLSVDEGMGSFINQKKVSCCYKVINRLEDDFVRYGDCLDFKRNVTLPASTENVLVRCRIGRKRFFNAYPLIPERNQVQERLDDWKRKDTRKPLSVIMIGINGVSRVNLIRAMPRTAQHLYDSGWFELAGYNKMGTRTFPNLMAILTGLNESHSHNQRVKELRDCKFIWETFKKHGYVTAYGVDDSFARSLNRIGVGLREPPVDYYFRPFFIDGVDELPSVTHCIDKNEPSFLVHNYALDLDTRYSSDNYFGLFWTNSFKITPSSIDNGMAEFLKDLANRAILERSVVIFLSDHGTRWGPTIDTIPGYYDDRLPFLFISLPQWLKETQPELVKALKINRNRLTSPYDVHMTLKHILELSGRAKNLSLAEDCPKCQSLLRVIPENRSCADAAILGRWCACTPWTEIDETTDTVKKLVDFTINHLNKMLVEYKNGSLTDICSPHTLRLIKSSHVGKDIADGSVEMYLIYFKTGPSIIKFEALLRYFVKTGDMEVISVNPVRNYSPESDCVGDIFSENICSCIY